MNPLLSNSQGNGNGIFDILGQIKQASGGNLDGFANQAYHNDPGFRDFANSMKGHDPYQEFAKIGVDFNQVRKVFGK